MGRSTPTIAFDGALYNVDTLNTCMNDKFLIIFDKMTAVGT